MPVESQRGKRKDARPAEEARSLVVILGLLCVWVAFLLLSAGCGYHVAGRGSRLPASLKTIAVPALENRTSRYRIEQRLTEALVHELLSRTSYQIVADPGAADAVLRGQVVGLESSPLVFDTATGRAATFAVTVHLAVRLEERETKKLLYRNDNFIFREQYEVSTDIPSFFDELNPALDRLARDFAGRLVAALLENF